MMRVWTVDVILGMFSTAMDILLCYIFIDDDDDDVNKNSYVIHR